MDDTALFTFTSFLGIGLGLAIFLTFRAVSGAARRDREQWDRTVGRLEDVLGADAVDRLEGQKAVFLNVEGGTLRAEAGYLPTGMRQSNLVRMSTGPSKGRLVHATLASRAGSVARPGAPAAFTPNMRTGDPLFDAAISLRGRQGEVLGRLDAETRALLVRAVAVFDLKLQDGLLSLELPADSIDPRTLGEACSTLAGLVRRLSHDEAVPSRLEDLARTDPESGVREAAARKLLDGWLKGKRRLALARDLLHDAEPRIRLLAAGQGTAGAPQVLRELAADEDLGIQVRLRAVSRLPREGNEDLLRLLLHSPSDPLRRAAAQALGLVDPADVGRISLSEGEDGALSLQAERGGVAIAS